MRRPFEVALLLALGALPGCGRKTLPLPPILEVPETTTDMWAYQDAEEVVLNWAYPQLTRAGRALTDLARIEVWRLEVPPGQGEVGAGPAGFALRYQLILSRGKLVGRLEGDSLVAATRGGRLIYRDPLPEFRAGTTPPSLWYAVRSRRRNGTASAFSNIVTWQPTPVPPMPTGVVATVDASGITLVWDEIPGFTYVVERRATNLDWDVVSPIGMTEPTFKDVSARQGETWCFRVRALLGGKGIATASPPSPELEVAYPDIYPPPPPSSFVCLPEPGDVRLRWDPSPEAGVSYQVQRRQGENAWEMIDPDVVEAEFTDATPPPGEVQYSVRAMDAAGNASTTVTCTVRTSP
jgi:hypothetical protein